MKRLLSLVLCAGLSATAVASVRVTPPVIHLSKQNPYITVLLNGAPVVDTTLNIDLYRDRTDSTPSKPRHLRLATNSNGIFTLPHLHPGYYEVVVHARPNSLGYINLAIAPPDTNPHYASFMAYFCVKARQTSNSATPGAAFQLRLTSYPTRAQWLARHAVRVSAFQGTVQDVTGAQIPHAQISIYKLNGSHKRLVEKIKANQQGAFSALLPDGEYIVHFMSSQVLTKTMEIIISHGASNHPLRITLRMQGVGN